MANTTRRNWQMPLERTGRDISIEQDQRTEGMGVSWGGIWAGVLVALGTLLLLSTLGLAVGIAANAGAGAGAANGANAGTMSTAAVIWSAISLLISMFLGGLASTRMGRIFDRGSGMFHGALVWVITLGAILYLGLRGLGLMGANSSMGFSGNASSAANAAASAANAHPGATTGIGWSPFIIAALSLLASLAGAASGLRRLFTDVGDRSTRLYDDTNRPSSTTTTTTTNSSTQDNTRDRDRY